MPGGKIQCFPRPSICPATERVIHYSACARLDCSPLLEATIISLQDTVL